MTMTHDQEEAFLIDKVLSARHELALKKDEARILKLAVNQLEQYAADCETALLDYYKTNGIAKSTCGDFTVTIGNSISVDVADVESVPEKYIRTKIIKEVNKALIRAEGLEANNWLSYSHTPTVTIKHKDA